MYFRSQKQNKMKKTILSLIAVTSFFYSYAQSWVKTDFKDIKSGDTIIIADLTSGVALKSSIRDKSANIKPITFNDDKTKIISDVTDADSIQWEIEKIDSEYIFYAANTDKKSWFYYTKSNNYLFIKKTTDKANTGKMNKFIFDEETGYLTSTQITDTVSRKVGVYYKDKAPYEWRTYFYTDKNIKNTVTAFFKQTDTTLPDAGDNSTPVSKVYVDNKKTTDVYNLLGQRVKTNVPLSEALKDLPKGIYIIDGKRYLISK